MANEARPQLNATAVAMSAVFAAAVAVATILVPVPWSSGYLNFGEVVIYTAAFLFGRVVGGLSGGIGAAAADVYLGFGIYAPVTLLVKGTEGYLVGRFAGASIRSKVFAVVIGAPVMIAGYVIYTSYLYGVPAGVQELGIDILQAVVGAIVAIPLSHALKSRIPELR